MSKLRADNAGIAPVVPTIDGDIVGPALPKQITVVAGLGCPTLDLKRAQLGQRGGSCRG